MADIEFTQFLRPHGQPRIVTIHRPDEVSVLADKIVKDGYTLECEVLISGMVSLTVSDEERDIAIELVNNGPEVPDAVDRLIYEAIETLY